MSYQSLFGVFPWVLNLFLVARFVLVCLVAVAIKRDADRRVASHAGVFLVGPWLWFWLTVVVGLLAALAYWVIHYSSLRREHVA